MDRAEAANTDLQAIRQEWTVTDAEGNDVGVVNEVHVNYLWVQQGLLFPKDVYIPAGAVASVTEGRVRLKVTAAEIVRAGWDTLPEELGSV